MKTSPHKTSTAPMPVLVTIYTGIFMIFLLTFTYWKNIGEWIRLSLLPLSLFFLWKYRCPPRSFFRNPAFISLAFFFLVAVLSLLANGYGMADANRPLNWMVAYFIGFVGALLFRDACRDVFADVLLLAPLGAALFAVAMYTLQLAGMLEGDYGFGSRLYLFSHHPNQLASLYGTLSVIAFAHVLFGRRPLFRWVGLALSLVLFSFMILTWSRTGVFSAVITAAVMLAIHYRRKWKLLLCIGAIFVLLAGVLFQFGDSSPTVQRFRTILEDPRDEYAIQGRLTIWHVAWEKFKSRPLLGIGFNKFKKAYRSEIKQNEENLRQQFEVVETVKHPHAHNFFLHFMAETGLLGVLPMCVLWFYVIIAGFRSGDSGFVIASCFLYQFLNLQLNMHLYIREVSMIVFILAGALAFFRSSPTGDFPESVPAPSARR